MGQKHEYNILVRERHLDFFGHMNNATYLEIFEEARWEMLQEGGVNLQEIRRLNIGPIILEVNLKFLKELRLRENITLTTEMIDYQGKIGHIKQQMIKTDGTVASEAIFTFGLFDLSARKLVEPAGPWKTALGI